MTVGIRHSINQVQSLFQEKGFELLDDEYGNNKTLLNCQCNNCQHKLQVSYYDVRTGYKCPKCNNIEEPSNKFTYDHVKSIFSSYGCTLLSKEYVNSKTLMDYICPNGHEVKITLNHLQEDKKCKECSKQTRRMLRQVPIEEVKEIFAAEGCTLLENEYKNNKTTMNFKCKCGLESTISLYYFKKIKKCTDCKKKEAEK